MPHYRLYALSPQGPSQPPIEMAAFDDGVIMRWAMRGPFPDGCDIWQDARFVGRVHGPRQPAPPDD